MKLALFTSNQPRHIALAERMAAICEELFVVAECNTVFPGVVDDFFRKSDVMAAYFERVRAAEATVFGSPRFLPSNACVLALKLGDASGLDPASFAPALQAETIVVFGASYLRGALADALIARGAINIHMGTSPFYRGSSCNFWALYDGKPEYVGATIHLLGKGLDSGEILYHALPKTGTEDAFTYGMRAVEAAHSSLAERIRDRTLQAIAPVPQDRTLEMRYTRRTDFTDDIARAYLDCPPRAEAIAAAVASRPMEKFIRPYVS